MPIEISENEAKVIYLALYRGAQHEREDILGLFLKTSGSQLLDDKELVALLDKIECGREGRNFPRYEMIFEGGSHYLPLWQAGAWYDCGWTKVEIGEWVIDADHPLARRRQMNDTDRDRIRYEADRHSERK